MKWWRVRQSQRPNLLLCVSFFPTLEHMSALSGRLSPNSPFAHTHAVLGSPAVPLNSSTLHPSLCPSARQRRVPARGRPASGWRLCFYFTRSAFCLGLTLGVFQSFSCIGSPQSATPWRKPGRSVCSRYPVRACIVCGAFCVCATTIRHTREPDQVWLAAA